jgi:hypothetical protein
VDMDTYLDLPIEMSPDPSIIDVRAIKSMLSDRPLVLFDEEGEPFAVLLPADRFVALCGRHLLTRRN